MTIKKKLSLLLAVPALSLLLNFNWVHAATVVAWSGEDCDSDLLAQSRQRVATLFGEVESDPIITCLRQASLGLGRVIGTTHFAPGLPAVIILNPDGENLDVMAHEWAHAELAARLGVLARSYALPVWFDEGLAMQLDHRPAYADAALLNLLNAEGVEVPDAESIAGAGEFFRPGQQGRLHYALSRCVVAHLLVDVELAMLLREVSLSNPFDYEANAQVSQCVSTAEVG